MRERNICLPVSRVAESWVKKHPISPKNGNLIEVKDEYLEMADKAIKVIEDCHALLDADDIMID